MLPAHPVRVRFAPSPTGHVHLGSARTALYDYLLAKQQHGQFILRIEDTDRKRLIEGAEQELFESLRWLGLNWDEGPDVGGAFGPYRQSERKEIYLQHAEELMARDAAYYCFCSPERLNQVRQTAQKSKQNPHYDGFCRGLSKQEAEERVRSGEPHVIRFKAPKQGVTVVHDLLRGDISFDNTTLDDSILVKSDGWALYHLAAVVDDHLMGVTHVIRGSEWLPTSPLHSLIWKAFSWREPYWVHLSVFLKPSGKGKMSKREAVELSQDGYSIFVKDLKDLGYLPEAVINWVALMGWSYDDRSEYFTLDDLVQKFSLEKLNPSPAAINFSKLDHFNKLHIKALADIDLAERIRPFFQSKGYPATLEQLLAIVPLIRERIVTLDDSVTFCAFLFEQEIRHERELLMIKDKSPKEAVFIAEEVLGLLREIQTWELAALEPVLTAYMQKMQLTPREFFGFLREVISAQRITPPLFECMQVLGKQKTLQRLQQAIQVIKA